MAGQVEQRYRILKQIESGGMAEVFRGEALSVEGFRKKVAIKRVLPHLAKNQKFIAMFLDEARLGARLNHANIVSVLDIGAADETFFIVMEYIDGSNLKSISESYAKQGRPLGLKESIFLCMECCRALSYAHELVDDNEQPLHIVHRDVSPPNILISRRGEVKIADFGLAKAATQLEKTDPGIVKGKFSYLSPEAASGLPVDARSDIFSLGVVLWELLAARKLFQGESDYETVKAVQVARIPPLGAYNSDIDSAFEQVLAKALAKHPDERYQSAAEFGDALADYLFNHKMKVTSVDLAKLVTEVAGERVETTRAFGSPIDQLIQEQLLKLTSVSTVGDTTGRGSRPLAPHELIANSGAPKPSGLENPQDWFSDDADVAQAFNTYVEPSDSQAGWSEVGLAEELEEIDAQESSYPQQPTQDARQRIEVISPGSVVSHRPSSSAELAQAFTPQYSSSKPLPQGFLHSELPSLGPAKKRGNKGLVVAGALVLAVCGAAAFWFLKH